MSAPRWVVVLLSVFALLGCGGGGDSTGSSSGKTLKVFCAAGMKKPVTAIAEAYREEYGVEVQLQFAGTGTLMTQIEVAKQGDLFVAADADSVEIARGKGLVKELLPIARQYPVVAVKKGNPLGIESLDDLFAADLRIAVGNPEAASIGKATEEAIGDRWEEFRECVDVMKPTVTEIALDLTVDAVDVAIVWNSTVPQFKGIEAVRLPEFDAVEDQVGISVLAASEQPTEALKFARYLVAPDKGGATLRKLGLEAIPGDEWAEQPELVLYSGGVNRPALEPLLEEWAEREGVELTTVFNGCGILCASMQAIQEQEDSRMPDAYYACDLCFVPPVADRFPEAVMLTETDIGIAVKKGNPHGIKTLVDLADPDLKVGLCNAKQSTLGYMTAGMLRDTGLENSVRAGVDVEVPTADFLINQMRAGALDAAIVYRVNAMLQKDHIDFLPIEHEGAKAVQPFSVRADSPRRQLAGRLLAFLRLNRASFEDSGFQWRGETEAIRSDEIEIPFWLRKPGERGEAEGEE